ncbi:MULTISPECIES: FAD-dependent oxidoreductase [unclassified Gordonia (in: high G+C Gram-positive bacteria)]|uniref:FAD-dependent oxidoreductase n=1 Tax=unclassified Gordonia (in: high G+C Gram-positive bacteria) TaxID=2657482 RepID=UPI0007EC294B|nr:MULTISPECIES: FAD-dependent oxidoreductase [unclassified Gordonia (in: high G+C Gram-positive bacteria)]OBC04160.1 oxidoreductase [Gordonia sp. 852002-50395_SCH5434458]OBC08459.1 oxidoreductase [Gordonia sp. 852002-50816_SCH5313054-a]OBC20688.1 oxidoreductase [Gordonia sp. 852002-50816_SCH5313054-c]
MISQSSTGVTVIGGGIAGLVVAYRLAQRNVPVTVLEQGTQLGGLGVEGEIGGHPIERFYHCIMPSDDALLELLDDLGLRESIEWRSTTMGMLVDRHRYPFNTPLDLLRFRALSILERVRFGAVSVTLRYLGRGKDLDHMTTEAWLSELYGPAVWAKLLKPMLGAKFGDAFSLVPARYIYERLGREKNVAVRGYPSGGYRSIVEALCQAIRDRGGIVETSARVTAVTETSSGVEVALDDRVITSDFLVSTVPIPVLHQLADESLRAALPPAEHTYQGVVNAAFLLRKPLDGHYWSPVIGCDTEFDGVIEMSALSGTHRYGDHSLVYTMKYTTRDSPLFSEDSDAIAARWTSQLCALYPDRIASDDVLAAKVFAAPFVEPIPFVGQSQQISDGHVPNTRLSIATTTQLYPDVTSWNSSTRLAESVARRVATAAVSVGTR